MFNKKKFLIGAATLLLTIAGGAGALAVVIPDPVKAPAEVTAATNEEYWHTIELMKPPKRQRPLVAVIGDNRGSEAIDFLVPYGVLKRSGAADVYAVGMSVGPLKLRPALTVEAHLTAADFDRRFPKGADYIVVPAMFDHQSPEVLAWIQSQSSRGATIVAICAGAEMLANGGLLKGRASTTHWASVAKVLKAEPTARWIPHRRYVADQGVVTTTGVSAAVPVSIAMVEAIAGPVRAQEVARDLGVREWGRSHDSGAYGLNAETWTLLANSLRKWKHEDVGIPVSDGVDDIALALTADSWSRTYRSKALTVAPATTVRTRGGLNLVVDRINVAGLERVLAAVDARQPARALPRSIGHISSAYGKSTGRLVAVQLEYDGRLSK